jgi:hypothetical protein
MSNTEKRQNITDRLKSHFYKVINHSILNSFLNEALKFRLDKELEEVEASKKSDEEINSSMSAFYDKIIDSLTESGIKPTIQHIRDHFQGNFHKVGFLEENEKVIDQNFIGNISEIKGRDNRIVVDSLELPKIPKDKTLNNPNVNINEKSDGLMVEKIEIDNREEDKTLTYSISCKKSNDNEDEIISSEGAVKLFYPRYIKASNEIISRWKLSSSSSEQISINFKRKSNNQSLNFSYNPSKFNFI